jgi:hypothetical protein
MDPLRDENYIAGHEARKGGRLVEARTHFERAAGDGNFVALGELCSLCDQLGDVEAARVHAKKLEELALMSAEVSYVAAMYFDSCYNTFGLEGVERMRVKYLLNSAEIGNPIAELEVGSNYWDGANGFRRDPDQARYWIRRGQASLAPEPLPDWAAAILEE